MGRSYTPKFRVVTYDNTRKWNTFSWRNSDSGVPGNENLEKFIRTKHLKKLLTKAYRPYVVN